MIPALPDFSIKDAHQRLTLSEDLAMSADGGCPFCKGVGLRAESNCVRGEYQPWRVAECPCTGVRPSRRRALLKGKAYPSVKRLFAAPRRF